MGKGKGLGEDVTNALIPSLQAGTEATQAATQRAGQSFQMGQQAWQPSFNYWDALMKGGQPARVATGPMAEEIGNVYDAQRRSISENLPRGGERNLAMAQSDVSQARDVSRLYAGMQPQAAEHLAQLSGIPFGVSTSMTGIGASGTQAGGTLLDYARWQQETLMNSVAGVGSMLGKFI